MMSRKWIALSLAAFIIAATGAAAQSPSSLFDERKAAKELEVMEGILQTTLKFVTREISDEEAVLAFAASSSNFLRLGGSSVDSFYLYDQGAVFVVDLPGIRTGRGRVFSAIVDEPKGVVSGVSSTSITSQRLLELQEQVKKQQEEFKKEAEEHRQRLDEVKGFLIEALANHGDSLTILKDGEYINLVLNSPSDNWRLLSNSSADRLYTGSRRTEYISVQKSWISDYKAGRLTLDQFKQKALSY